jgi:HD-GYP domain-containing protein (c-di-GMP phosphodiesterase class II)
VAHYFEPAVCNFLHSGAQTLRQLQFSEDVIASIYSHKHSISLNDAANDRSETRRMFVHLARLAKDIDGVYMRSGQEAIQSYINAWCKQSVFDPTFISSVARAVHDDDVWRVLYSDELALHLRDVAPEFQTIPVDEDYLDYIAAAFGCIIDIKSADTSGHSRRVVLYVDLIADRLEFEQSRRRCLHRGAFLHDIGKLGISNALLNKPGKLSSAEWVVMRKHAGYTEEIIASMEPFIELARTMNGLMEKVIRLV